MQEQLAPLLQDLLYPSESDEPVEYISFESSSESETLTAEELRCLVPVPENEQIQERDPEDFWSKVTEYRDWYDDFEKNRTATFQKIKAILEENLTDIRYFEAGKIEVKLFVLGRSKDKIEGITTTAIRT